MHHSHSSKCQWAWREIITVVQLILSWVVLVQSKEDGEEMNQLQMMTEISPLLLLRLQRVAVLLQPVNRKRTRERDPSRQPDGEEVEARARVGVVGLSGDGVKFMCVYQM
jgi:hypothetical protein